jgi:hypothetical protein
MQLWLECLVRLCTLTRDDMVRLLYNSFAKEEGGLMSYNGM